MCGSCVGSRVAFWGEVVSNNRCLILTVSSIYDGKKRKNPHETIVRQVRFRAGWRYFTNFNEMALILIK